MLLISIALVIWFGIGLGFGLPRAAQKYREEVTKYPLHYRENPTAVKAEAMIDAGITLTRWMLLGLLAAIAFVAWRIWDIYLTETRRRGR